MTEKTLTMAINPITSIRGFNDVLPPESALWRRIEKTAIDVFLSHGFSEVRLPIAEKTELFSRSIGEVTDIVEKEMYTFADRNGDFMTLRPEGTASVVRAYIEHKLYTAPVARLFYTGPMFRYERPQKGRYRQFYQIGAEVLGESSPRSDAETIAMLAGIFTRLKLKGVSLQINSLGCAECRPSYKEKLKSFLSERTDKLCENCRRRLDANPLRALDCKSPGCKEATDGAPFLTDTLCTNCKTHFDKVRSTIDDYGVTAVVNPRMVRGLDYYTKTAFEITAEGLGSQNAVAAGGRYDKLVEELGGTSTPCFGFAIGLERVALLAAEAGLITEEPPLVVVVAMGEKAERRTRELIAEWRGAGMRVVEEFSEGGMKQRMKRADRLGARYVIILGDDELSEGVVTLKDMTAATQVKVAFDQVMKKISA